VWLKRRVRCAAPGCATDTFTEVDARLAEPRARLTKRAVDWCVRQMRREHATARGLARQLGVGWDTVWDAVEHVLRDAAADETRFKGVGALGVDEHTRHHGDQRKHGHKMMTGMVDLTPGPDGKPRARLLDLVEGRSGGVYRQWLTERGTVFTSRVKVATLDPFHGYKNAIDDELQDAIAVLDRFHVQQLATKMVDEVRCRVQLETLGHRGRRGDPLYGIRNILKANENNLTDRQAKRLGEALAADEFHEEVYWAWRVAQDLAAAYDNPNPKAGRDQARRLLHRLRDCPIKEARRLGATLRRWREAYLAYWTERGASNGGTEAVNNLIELHRRIARGIPNKDHYRLRMLLIGGGLDPVLGT
jgi:transposase